MNLRIEKWNCLFAVLVLFFLGTLFLHSMKCFIDQSAVHAASQKKFSEPEPIDPQIVLPSPYPESSISKTEKSEINKVTGTNVNEGKPEPGKDAQITRNMQKYPA